MSQDFSASPAPQESRVLSVGSLNDLKSRSQNEFEVEFYEGILARNSAYPEVLTRLGQLYTNLGRHQLALGVDRIHARIRPSNPTVLYNLACSQALCGELKESLSSLQNAVQHGYDDMEHLGSDPDLFGLHDFPPFIQWITEQTLPDAPRYC